LETDAQSSSLRNSLNDPPQIAFSFQLNAITNARESCLNIHAESNTPVLSAGHYSCMTFLASVGLLPMLATD